MNLHAILCWYDESPTWLAATVASLARIGVTHLVAVDGKYPAFKIGATHRSRIDQVDALTNTAHAAGLAFTVHQPPLEMSEADKRALAFRIVESTANVFEDWCIIIDADELFVTDQPGLCDELAELPSGVHVAAARITNAVDPFAKSEPDNDVTGSTREMHQKLPIDPEFGALQSRLFRVLRGLTCETTHYSYQGSDSDGVHWNLRPDIAGKRVGLKAAEVVRLNAQPTIQHRKNHRTFERRASKRSYYDLRNELGLERVQVVT